MLPFCIESFICRNISDSSSQSVLKLITQIKSLIKKKFQITKIVRTSVLSSTDVTMSHIPYNIFDIPNIKIDPEIGQHCGKLEYHVA